MFTGLQPHTNTRCIGLPWLDTIPAHWDVQRAKQVMFARDVRSITGTEELLTVSSTRGIIPRSTANVAMFQAATYVGHKLCWPDDLVINSLWAWARGLGVSASHGIVSTAYGVYRLRDATRLLPSFLHYLVRSEPFQWELEVRSQGVWKSRLQMTDARWLDSPILLPPAEEQAAIVKYLAHATARIDKAIATKRRLLSLLDEQRQIAVQQTLAASAAEFPSRRLKSLIRGVDQGISPQADNQAPQHGEWGVLKAGAVNGGVFRNDQIKRLPSDFVVPTDLSVQNGDLLVSRASGSPNLVGSAALVHGITHQAILSDKLFRLNLTGEVDAEFMELSMNSPAYREQVLRAISGAEGLANNLPLTALLRFRFLIPPVGMQRCIVTRAQIEAAARRKVEARTRYEIDLLCEFRTRLIADVVTGQVDVRAIAASLPDVDPTVAWGTTEAGDESEEPELDEALAAADDDPDE